jgi:hypothetical protein
MEEIFLHSLSVKEAQIVDYFLKDLKDEVRGGPGWTSERVDGVQMRARTRVAPHRCPLLTACPRHGPASLPPRPTCRS